MSILNDILDFSKIEAGRMEVHVAPLALRALLDTTLKPLQASAAGRGIELAWEVAPELGDAAILVDINRADEAAQKLDGFFANPIRECAARKAAWDIAHKRFCWDIEKEKLLKSVHAFLK